MAGYAEGTNPNRENLIMGSTLSGLISLIIFALDIWAIINVVKSGAEMPMKIIWILVIVILPVLGLIIWAIAGPRGNVRV
ncbi:hypothetical protein J2T49_004163 [Pseudomonas nitroreducens]|nr:hypothetical protein [Pseudomonas nitroreducens]MCP1688198.1 hypothetical protein [Pseudomonas nitroreducens]